MGLLMRSSCVRGCEIAPLKQLGSSLAREKQILSICASRVKRNARRTPDSKGIIGAKNR